MKLNLLNRAMGFRGLGACAARALAAASICIGMGAANAGLFDDDEARKAILELRQRNDALRLSIEETGKRAALDSQRRAEETKKLGEDNAQLRLALIDLQNQIEVLKQDQARLRGQDEQVLRELADAQRRQKDVAGLIDERFRKLEPIKVNVDGRDFIAEQSEKRDHDAALEVFRKGDFTAAQTLFFDFIKRYPQSGYAPTSLFWLANAQYALREYKESVTNFRSLVSQFPEHPRSPEAMLSLANCHIELKDTRAARKTLEDLSRLYPQSEAATAGKERLARLK